jgi:tetratricopeptide (TPR) repeat protein
MGLAWIVSLTLGAGICAAGDPEVAFARGRDLMAKGELRAALKAYADAVQSDPSNQKYTQQFMLVRQAILLENALTSESDPQRWQRTAQALRSLYTSQGLFALALPVDKALYSRTKTSLSAVQLAETELALGNNAGAAKLLASLDSEKITTASQSLLSVALARQDEREKARAIAQTVLLEKNADPGTMYLVARMRAALGDSDRALSTLKRCFEAVPPSRLDSLKSHAKACADFAALAAGSQFASVLETQSKVPESKCSGGSSCSNCPMRGGCQHNRGK